MNNPVRRCETCHFYAMADAENGTCRRYAPRASVDERFDGYEESPTWPKMAKNDWCGEYEPWPRTDPETPE